MPKAMKFADGTPVWNDWNRMMSTCFNGSSNIVQAGGLACLSGDGYDEMIKMVNFYKVEQYARGTPCMPEACISIHQMSPLSRTHFMHHTIVLCIDHEDVWRAVSSGGRSTPGAQRSVNAIHPCWPPDVAQLLKVFCSSQCGVMSTSWLYLVVVIDAIAEQELQLGQKENGCGVDEQGQGL